MSLFRRTYEPIQTIIHPGSPPEVSWMIFHRITFTLLAVNALIAFTLIMTVVAVGRYTVAIKACGITYLVVFLTLFTISTALYVRIVYFKHHPPRSPPHGYTQPISGKDYDNEHGKSVELECPMESDRTSSWNVEFNHIEQRHHKTPSQYDQTQYRSPFAENPYRQTAETSYEHLEQDERAISGTGGKLSEIAQGALSNNYHGGVESFWEDPISSYRRQRSSYDGSEPSSSSKLGDGGTGKGAGASPQVAPIIGEAQHYPQHSEGDVNRHNSARVAIFKEEEEEPRRCMTPFSPSLRQLTGGVRGDPGPQMTYEEATASLRANWQKRDG